MKAAIETLGCRVNQYESEAICELLIKNGYEIVHFDEYADVYIINTCTVTGMSDKKSRQMAKRSKRINPDSVVAVIGCFAQVSSLEVSQIEGVDIVLGTRNKSSIIYNINKFLFDRKQIVCITKSEEADFEELKIEKYNERSRAYIKIQDGCNNFCSYCIIPYARGRVCSRKPCNIIDEIKKLAENDFKEIILTGINTTSYGNDIHGEWNLLKILCEVDKIPGIERIRMGSLDPLYFSDDVIDKMSKIKKLCPHFHLSLQSGCDSTLNRMNRHYTTKFYESISNKLRNKIPFCSITTDIIVGFPGETEEEFNTTYEFLKRIKLTKMHVFKYSKRKGTNAAKMPDQISPIIKDERSKKIIELGNELENEFLNSLVGQSMDVLYEQKSSYMQGGNDDESVNYYEGYAPNYVKVIARSNHNICGKILCTRFFNAKNEYIYGEID